MEHNELLTAGGSFRDLHTEARFRRRELVSMQPLLSVLIPALGIAFELFALPDYFVLGPGPDFLIALTARSFFLAVCLITAILLRTQPESSGIIRADKARPTNHSLHSGSRPHIRNASSHDRVRHGSLIAVTSMTGTLAFAVIVFLYRNGNFYLQAMSVLLMISALFLLPNRLPLSCALAFVVSGAGIASMAFVKTKLLPREIPAVFVDFGLAAAIGAVASWRTARARRLEFARTEELERISGTDPLTGLANRRAFEKIMREILGRMEIEGIKASLGVFDLDNLKPVNDRYGHEAGDSVLMETANLLIERIGNKGCAARWGGDEMVFLLEGADMDETVGFAEGLRQSMESIRLDKGIRVTASFGVASLKVGDDGKKAVARADKALYKAKVSGKNRVVAAE